MSVCASDFVRLFDNEFNFYFIVIFVVFFVVGFQREEAGEGGGVVVASSIVGQISKHRSLWNVML